MLLPSSMNELPLRDAPAGRYGYIMGINGYDQQSVELHVEGRASYYFEVHKLRDGRAALVGFVTDEELAKVGSGPFSLYSVLWDNAPHAVALELASVHTATLVDGGRTVDVGNPKRSLSVLDIRKAQPFHVVDGD